LFSDPAVIEATRNFVCIRIDSYESEENQKIVRSHLGGRFENTAFCVLAPDGKTRLTRSGRGPHQVARNFNDLTALVEDYSPRGNAHDSKVPDFNSFALALNVSSADQQVLVVIAGPDEEIQMVGVRLRPMVWSDDMVGRFQYDFETDMKKLEAPLALKKAEPGIYIIKPDTFGLDGEVMASLPLDVQLPALKAAMVQGNTQFARSTKKKIYSTHVADGRRAGKRIKMAMPFGEDRDGDGKIDHRAGSGRQRR